MILIDVPDDIDKDKTEELLEILKYNTGTYAALLPL